MVPDIFLSALNIGISWSKENHFHYLPDHIFILRTFPNMKRKMKKNIGALEEREMFYHLLGRKVICFTWKINFQFSSSQIVYS
jgi:hypothetical protein